MTTAKLLFGGGEPPSLKLHERYLNSCEGKEFARRKLLYVHLL